MTERTTALLSNSCIASLDKISITSRMLSMAYDGRQAYWLARAIKDRIDKADADIIDIDEQQMCSELLDLLCYRIDELQSRIKATFEELELTRTTGHEERGREQ